MGPGIEPIGRWSLSPWIAKEVPETEVFKQCCLQFNREKIAFSTNVAGTNGYPHAKE